MNSTSSLDVSIFGAVWRYRLLVAASAIAGAVIVPTASAFLLGGDTVEATASVVVSDTSEFAVGAAEQPERFVGNQVEVLRSLRVADRTIELLEQNGYDEVNRTDLISDLRVFGNDTSDEIVIRYSSTDPTLAIAAVNSVLQAYREINAEQSDATAQAALDRIDAEIEVLDQRISEIRDEVASLETSDGIANTLSAQATDAISEIVRLQTALDATGDLDEIAALTAQLADLRARVNLFLTARAAVGADADLQVLLEAQARSIERRAALVERRDQILIDTALTPGVVVFEDPAVETTAIVGFTGIRALAAGLVLGALMGGAIATVRAAGGDVVPGRRQVGEILSAPLLAAIPEFRGGSASSHLPVRDHPASESAEAFRFALSALTASLDREGAKSVLFASPSPQQGTTTTVANIAIAAAQQRSRVLAWDADFVEQRLSRALREDGSDEEPAGLTDFIDGNPLRKATADTWEVKSLDGYLSVLSSGTKHLSPLEILGSPEVHQVAIEAKREFDLVIVDSPAVLRVAYVGDLMKLFETVVAVVPSWCTNSELVEFRDRCAFMNVPIIGFVYTRRSVDTNVKADA